MRNQHFHKTVLRLLEGLPVTDLHKPLNINNNEKSVLIKSRLSKKITTLEQDCLEALERLSVTLLF